MDLRIVPDADAIAQQAADMVAELLAAKPTAHFCLPAGRSPRPLYAELTRRATAGLISFEQARFTQLDEWYGLLPDDPGTCLNDLREHLATPLGLRSEQWLGFDSAAEDPLAECARVAVALAERGDTDLCLLGLGLNGHLGLNEPAGWLSGGPHLTQLSASTRKHSMLAHLAQPPTHGMTLGLADLMRAARILVLVSGADKREALERMVKGPISSKFPASLLQWHADCVVLADAEAGGT
ncbi:MAG: 6-phosphogluconolactonase [Armatimonadetes bacterium]|nr:6-phosphogluconolactonase [Armatimonadota bacterium]